MGCPCGCNWLIGLHWRLLADQHNNGWEEGGMGWPLVTGEGVRMGQVGVTWWDRGWGRVGVAGWFLKWGEWNFAREEESLPGKIYDKHECAGRGLLRCMQWVLADGSLKIYEGIINDESDHGVFWFKYWWLIWVIILHMPRQLSCRGMCKILAWMDNCFWSKMRMLFDYMCVLTS